jgi:hypothetical protein
MDEKPGSRAAKSKDKAEREKTKSPKKERTPSEEYMKKKRGSMTKSLLATPSQSS